MPLEQNENDEEAQLKFMCFINHELCNAYKYCSSLMKIIPMKYDLTKNIVMSPSIKTFQK